MSMASNNSSKLGIVALLMCSRVLSAQDLTGDWQGKLYTKPPWLLISLVIALIALIAFRIKRAAVYGVGIVLILGMANLAMAGSHSVNGVAELHSKLVTTTLAPDFYRLRLLPPASGALQQQDQRRHAAAVAAARQPPAGGAHQQDHRHRLGDRPRPPARAGAVRR